MYAAVKKIKVSLVRILVAHWLIVPTYRVGPIAICSLVTRIASNLDMLQGASLEFIEEDHDTFGYCWYLLMHTKFICKHTDRILM
jgi:hypothetical protein